MLTTCLHLQWRREHPDGALPPRLFTVGRLDVASVGLIFVTNDGAHRSSCCKLTAGMASVFASCCWHRLCSGADLSCAQPQQPTESAKCTVRIPAPTNLAAFLESFGSLVESPSAHTGCRSVGAAGYAPLGRYHARVRGDARRGAHPQAAADHRGGCALASRSWLSGLHAPMHAVQTVHMELSGRTACQAMHCPGALGRWTGAMFGCKFKCKLTR